MAFVMVSDSAKVTGRIGLQAANGDPLTLAYAVNFLEALYRNGYAVVELGAEEMAGSGTWDVTITDPGARPDDVLAEVRQIVDDPWEAAEMIAGDCAVLHDVAQWHAEQITAKLHRAGASVEAIDRLAECDATIQAQREGSQ